MKQHKQPDILSEQQAIQRLKDLPRPWADEYLAMYSSWLGGIVKEPWLMSVPIDDHLVHRGDGVFEATKCVNGRIYQFQAHLERLLRSARAISLELPVSTSELTALARAVVRAGGRRDCMLRIYLSRGPGGFTTSPAECPEAGLYLMASLPHPLPQAAYDNGVSVGISQLPAKSGFFATVKSCNYLPNVLLKQEALKRGWQFGICLDPEGYLAEGSTENIGLVDENGLLLLPPPHNILEGTTVRRATQLATELVDQGALQAVEHRPLSRDDLLRAAEVMLFGTTLDVLPVCRLEGELVGGGRPGPVAKRLLELMRADIRDNPEASLAVWD